MRTVVGGNAWDGFYGQCFGCRRPSEFEGVRGALGLVVIRNAPTYAAARAALNEHKAEVHPRPVKSA